MSGTASESGRKGPRWVAGALVLLAVAAGAGVLLWVSRDREPRAPAEGPAVAGPEEGAATPAAEKEAGEPSGAPAEPDPNEAVDRALRNEQRLVARTLLDAHQESDDAAYLMGLVYKEQGDSTQAIWWWKRSLELDPSRADANDSLGREALLREEFAEAERYFRRAMELDPTLPDLALRLATAVHRQGRRKEAQQVLLARPPLSAEGHRLLGEIAQQEQDLEAAARHFEAALAGDPDFAEAHYGLARTYARLGRADEAAKHNQAFRDLSAKDQAVGRHWRKAFDPLAVTVASVSHTHTDVARVYRALGNVEEAEKLWVRAASLDPRSVPCRLELAALRIQQNRVGEAARLYEQVAAIEPQDPVHQVRLGNMMARLRRYEEAEAAYRRAIELDPSRAEPRRWLANLFLHVGRNFAEARSLAEEAARLDPSAESQFTLAQAYDKTGDRRRAVSAIARAMELDPENAEYRRVYDLLTQDR